MTCCLFKRYNGPRLDQVLVVLSTFVKRPHLHSVSDSQSLQSVLSFVKRSHVHLCFNVNFNRSSFVGTTNQIRCCGCWSHGRSEGLLNERHKTPLNYPSVGAQTRGDLYRVYVTTVDVSSSFMFVWFRMVLVFSFDKNHKEIWDDCFLLCQSRCFLFINFPRRAKNVFVTYFSPKLGLSVI